jgi:SRSO17 transposase
MTNQQLCKLRRELDSYAEYLTAGMGRPERRAAMSQYLTGLLLDGERKSIEPMAARLVADERSAPALRLRLQQCITESTWSAEAVFGRVALELDRRMPGLEVWVVDDTGFAKQGTHSVGVARQYSGTLGKTGNCQVAVSLHVAGEQGGGCMGMRLYLPHVWTDDRERCRRARGPDEVTFQTKWRIALDLIEQALGWGMTRRVVLADAGYGDGAAFRNGLAARGLFYVVAVSGTQRVWPPGIEPLPPQATPGQPGRPRTRYRPPSNAAPLAIRELAARLGRSAYRKVTWREGSRGRQSSRFAAVRVRLAPARAGSRPPGPAVWLVCQWL